MKRVEVLWTGGFDSTFRISQLSRCDVEIRPVYVYNNDRKSRQYELNAISEITDMFKGLNQTKAKFLPLEIINKEDCGDDKAIAQAHKNIKKTDFIGTQYVFLANYSKKYVGVELSVHEDDTAIAIINKYGCLKKVYSDIISDYYVIDESESSQDIIELFGNYHFPLAKYAKKQMYEEFKKYDLTEIIDKTWFCHTPINDKPCGECNPCKYTIEEGLYGRFDKRAMFRYVLRKLRIKLIGRQTKKFFKITKKEIKKYLKYLRRDLRRYRKYLKKTRKVYANLFKKFRKEWKN